MSTRGFTLIELLVVIAIVAILAALLFPVFVSAKQSAKKVSCISNNKQIGTAAILYLGDWDDMYPQTRQHSSQPAVDDVSGAIDEPIYEQAFAPLQSYVRSSQLFACPEDSDPFGRRCIAIDPDAPAVTSYLVNAYFVFGLSQSSVTNSSNTIYVAERRSSAVGDTDPYCDDIYHPWFNVDNEKAPEDEMDAVEGAIATTRHLGLANYGFVDGHVKALHWGDTYAPPQIDMHLIQHP